MRARCDEAGRGLRQGTRHAAGGGASHKGEASNATRILEDRLGRDGLEQIQKALAESIDASRAVHYSRSDRLTGTLCNCVTVTFLGEVQYTEFFHKLPQPFRQGLRWSSGGGAEMVQCQSKRQDQKTSKETRRGLRAGQSSRSRAQEQAAETQGFGRCLKASVGIDSCFP